MNQYLLKSALAAILAAASFAATAAPILFISRSSTDLSIADALSGAGHTVTTVTGGGSQLSQTLAGGLSTYSSIYWSATQSYLDTDLDATVAGLTSYVSAGGRVFMTGYDSSYALKARQFVGGLNWLDTCGLPGTISNDANSLTAGVVDIRGMTPGSASGQTCDRDGVGGLGADTLGIVGSSGSPGYYQWTLRSLGQGQIAYVSNGNQSGDSPLWTNGSVYQSALLNFAEADAQVPEPGPLALLGLGLAGIGALRRRMAN